MQTRPLSERNRQLLTAANRSAPYLRTRRPTAGRLKLPLPSRAVGRVGFEPTKIAHHIISVAPLYLTWIPASVEGPRADPLSSDFRELIRFRGYSLLHSLPTVSLTPDGLSPSRFTSGATPLLSCDPSAAKPLDCGTCIRRLFALRAQSRSIHFHVEH